jgi:hypothetical protein
MNVVVWMVAGCALSSIAATLIVDRARGMEVVMGMFGPLLVATASWIVAERTWRREPARLTGVLITAFAGKLVFFAAYVAFMLSVLSLRPVPFVASFTTYFIALHVVEAVSLKRLFTDALR